MKYSIRPEQPYEPPFTLIAVFVVVRTFMLAVPRGSFSPHLYSRSTAYPYWESRV